MAKQHLYLKLDTDEYIRLKKIAAMAETHVNDMMTELARQIIAQHNQALSAMNVTIHQNHK